MPLLPELHWAHWFASYIWVSMASVLVLWFVGYELWLSGATRSHRDLMTYWCVALGAIAGLNLVPWGFLFMGGPSDSWPELLAAGLCFTPIIGWMPAGAGAWCGWLIVDVAYSSGQLSRASSQKGNPV